MFNKIMKNRKRNYKCEHEPTGDWQMFNGVSTAECKKCGKWYKTSLSINK